MEHKVNTWLSNKTNIVSLTYIIELISANKMNPVKINYMQELWYNMLQSNIKLVSFPYTKLPISGQNFIEL